jgi:hypothetical protein
MGSPRRGLSLQLGVRDESFRHVVGGYSIVP